MEQINHQGLNPSRVQNTGESIWVKWLYKSLDAVLTAPLNPKERKRDLLWSIIRKRSSNYNRITSFLNLLDRPIPGLSGRTARALLRLRNFPFTGYKVRLLAYGSGATVFLLENEHERKILKVFRRSLGISVHRVLQVAQEYQEKHRIISSWFNASRQVAVPSQYLLLHGPLLGVNCAALIQPYVEGKKFDLFLDFSEDEAVQLAQRDSRFRDQLLDFSRQLFAVVEEQNLCFDLVGRENLMLVETKEGIQLKIVDNGIFDLQLIREQSPVLYSRITNHLEKLHAIMERLESTNERRRAQRPG